MYLTGQTLQALKSLPRLATEYVFVNPLSGKPWQETRKMFRRACENAKLEGIWFHDLRRSFVTNARRRGVPESVVMKLSGHKTRSAFDLPRHDAQRFGVIFHTRALSHARICPSACSRFTGQPARRLAR